MPVDNKKIGNPDVGILKAIIDLLNQLGPLEAYDTDEITEMLIERGLWRKNSSKTPKRSINMYFSQNTDKNWFAFHRAGPSKYRLSQQYVKRRSREEAASSIFASSTKERLMGNLGLMLNGKAKWYENIVDSYNKNNGVTWIQQTMTIGKTYSDALQETIDGEGRFVAFGYIQSPVKKVGYVFCIDKIHTQYSEGVHLKSVTDGRVPPPDETVPEFDPDYDVEQGHCKDASDYKYKMWLRVKDVVTIDPPIDPGQFKPYTKDGPFKAGRAAHFYIDVANIDGFWGDAIKNSIYSASEEDSRKRTLSEIVQRRGQATFRDALMAAYSCKCAITGCDAREALEAAHISPYMGDHTNTVQNGLLLRADLHTLFDLGKLTISPEGYVTILHSDLRNGHYSKYNNVKIALPKSKSKWPSVAELERHKKRFGL